MSDCPLVGVAVEGGRFGGCLWFAAGGERNLGRGGDQKPLTLPGAVFPSFGVGLSQDSLDPLRSKYETHTPPPPCCAWDPLGEGPGQPGLR